MKFEKTKSDSISTLLGLSIVLSRQNAFVLKFTPFWVCARFISFRCSFVRCARLSRARLQIITLILATIWYNSVVFVLHSKLTKRRKSTTHQQFAWALKSLEKCYWFVGGPISVQWFKQRFQQYSLFQCVCLSVYLANAFVETLYWNIITFRALSKCRDREWDQWSIGLFGFRSIHGIFKRNWFIHSLMWLKCLLIVLFHLRSIMFITI